MPIFGFNGFLYHQFGPLSASHPAFAGISIHPFERDEIAEAQRAWGRQDESGSIPLLTLCAYRAAARQSARDAAQSVQL